MKTNYKTNPGEWIMKIQQRMQIRTRLAVLFTLCLVGTSAAASVLEDISFRSGSGGSVDIILDISGGVPEPSIFATENPPRIAIDLGGTSKGMKGRSVDVSSGATRSVSAVETNDRTRVVIDLFRSAPYTTEITGDQLIIRIKGANATLSSSARPSYVPPQQTTRSGRATVSNIDFRRGKTGEGKIIVTFDNEGANVDLSKKGSNLQAVFYNVDIPVGLEQRLDVLDFATPVEMIDTQSQGSTVVMNISVDGEYEHLAYQAGTEYVIEVEKFVEEVLTPEQLILEPQAYTGSRVTFNFQSIGVRAILNLLADVSGFNVVVSDTVRGELTLHLINVPWDQALDIVLQAKNLDKRINDNVMWVAPAAEIAAREEQLLQSLKKKRELEPLRSTFIQVNYAQATDLAELIQSAASDASNANTGLLSSRGSATVDVRTNILLLTDTPDRLDEIRALVTLLDRPSRQVQIESRIVIANDSFSNEMGVRFGVTGGREDRRGNIIGVSGSADAIDRMNNLALINRQLNANNSGFPFIGADQPPAGISVPPLGERLNVNFPSTQSAARWAVGILTSDYLLDLELSALETEGRGEVVSSPRIITTNQKEAFIKQGVEIPFLQASSSGAANIAFKEAVLELRVQPLITPDDRVFLQLEVKQDTVGEIVPLLGGEIPSIDTRELGTEVLVDSGQTVVLGGIYEQTVRLDRNKVPVLGDIPGIGNLFRQRTKQNNKGELLIFVTPTILNDNVRLN